MSAHRNTRQRQLILSCIERFGSHHFTADELTGAAHESDTSIGRATVYRYINQLHEDGLLRKFTLPDGGGFCWQYVADVSACHGHCHLKCNACGEVIHVDSALFDSTSESLLENKGFVVDMGDTVIYGTCAKCSDTKGDI